MQPTFIILFISGLLLGAAIAWVLRKAIAEKNNVTAATHEALKQQLQTVVTNLAVVTERETMLKTELNGTVSVTKEQAIALQQATNRIATLEADNKTKDERLHTQKSDLLQIGQQLTNEFKLLAGNVLDNNSKKFTEQQEATLKAILDPLKMNISDFKNEIVTRYTEETKERSSLKTEIKQVVEMNLRLSKEAENLTNALRGNTKQQGDWGEAILESILEYVGLQKNLHFTVQETGQNHDGDRIRPDVLVKYPDNRIAVIDSKVSLVHYEQYCAAPTDVEQKQFGVLLVRSVKAHIDGLASKKYSDLPGALDSVMMFVPIEAAFITASQIEPKLWQYAYDKGVILLSPTILLGAMKLIRDYWKRDDISRNAQEIAKKAGVLYDKLAGFVDNMNLVGSHLEKAKGAYDAAYGQLKTGRGNLISQAEQMKRLQIHAKKQLPKEIVEEAMMEDEDIDQPDNQLN